MSEVNYDELFDSVANAKPMGGFQPKLTPGTHLVAIKNYSVKTSAKKPGKDPKIECDFVIVKSDTIPVGAVRSWTWFISYGDFPEYEQERAKQFLECIKEGTGETKETNALGKDYIKADQKARGIVLTATVYNQLEDDGKTPKKSAKGADMTNANWASVKQTEADIAAMRAKIESGTVGQETVAAETTSEKKKLLSKS